MSATARSSHALNEAYRGLLMVGRMPVAFLHLEIPPEEVDVNVHPTKIEVRFRDSQRVYSHLLSTLRQTFLKSDLHSRLQSTQEPAAAEPAKVGAGAGAMAQPEQGSGADSGFRQGGSIGRFELAGGPTDRQTVASWFEPSGARPVIPESVGQPVPPPWAQSLPLGFPVGPGEAFDEFSTGAGAGQRHSRRQPPRMSTHMRCRERVRPSPARGRRANEKLRAPADSSGQPIEAGEPMVDRGRSRATAANRASRLQPLLKAIQVHDSYLIAETGDGMMVIDQHALHERILYEELRTRVAHGRVESQRLLVPEPVDMTAAEAAALVEQSELLGQLGLEVEPFGGDTVLVRSIPAMLPHVVPERLVRDLAEHFRTQPLPPTRDGLVAELLHMVACKAAVKAGQPLSAPEIAALLERRHLVADSHHCPHGRPTALVFTKADLEKQFGRI